MMSTTTTTSRAKPAASSLAASSRFGAFATVFSISGPLIYCVTQFLNYPLFTFFPATNRIVWGYEAARSGEGPNMLWYGWTVTTILVAAALGAVGMMLPERVIRRIPLALIWILPILAIPYIIYSLTPWWVAASR